jgi:hypothetical protein
MKQIEVVNKGTNAETAIRLAPVPETAIRLAPASEIAERLDRIEGSLKRTAGRIGRMENSFPAIVDRLNRLEKKLSTSFKISCKRLDGLEDDTHTHTMYSGTAVPITKEDAEGGSW